ncbi:MAG: LemA family protein [Fimbriimonadales bacterium]
MNTVLFAAGFGLLLIFVWVIVTLNRFARLRNLVSESWSNVDVALKRRHDLIPNLVKVVERYAQHERELLERIVALHNRLDTGEADLRALGRGETELSSLLGNVFATAEAYPELKSSVHFLDLQKELTNTEDRIAAARRFYNANVREYNIAVQSLPASLLAGDPVLPDFFEIEFSERLHPISS